MLKPLNANVVIEPIEAEKKTSSGILLTSSEETPNYAEGIVLAVGPGYPEFKMSVEVGDRVVYQVFEDNVTINHEGMDLLIMNEMGILAIIEEEK